MSYGVREYGVREYGDGMRMEPGSAVVIPPTDALAGTDTLTFGGSGTLIPGSTMMTTSGPAVTFAGSGVLSGNTPMVTETTTEKLTFGGWATLTAEVATVAPPATLRNVKRISPTMPTPVLDSRGRPT